MFGAFWPVCDSLISIVTALTQTLPVIAPGEPVLAQPPPVVVPARHMPHLAVLDGWRGVSILVVLASHLLPLGPKVWTLNSVASLLGMSFFFTLSGFLITGTLLYQADVRVFLVRRLCRIVPLVWLFLLVVLPLVHVPLRWYPPNLLFFANLPPFYLAPATGHLWSVCVEVQFYVFMAILFAVGGKRAFYALPVAAVAVTVTRVWAHDPASIVTWLRVDEILAGSVLLLLTEGRLGTTLPKLLRKVPFAVWFALAVLSCFDGTQWQQYPRPWLAMCLLGSVLFQPEGAPARWLRSPWLAYVAGISYALYVIHGIFLLPWFDGPTKMLRLAKRPLGVVLVWGLAHLSTRFYEAWWIGVGKHWSRRILGAEQPSRASGAGVVSGGAR